MKKVLVVALSVLVALSFCAVSSAQVGHVGHVYINGYDEVDTADILCTPDYNNCFYIEPPLPISDSNINMPGGTWTINLLSGVTISYDGPVSGTWTINVSGTGLDPDGILILNDSGEYDYFPLVGGVATISNASQYFDIYLDPSVTELEPSVSPYSTQVFLVYADSDTTGGGGGGGGGVGAFSPLMALLLAPLMLLTK